jgi:thiamine biosynthesis lipoprotein
MTESHQMLRARLAESSLTEVGEDFYEVLFRALGSQCQLLFIAPERAAAEAYVSAAFDWLSDFEARYSRFLPDSLLSQINAQAGVGWVEIGAQGDQLLDLCDHCHFVTQGAFDATSLPLTLLWDWKNHHATLPTEAEIAQARSLIGWKRVQRAPDRVFLPEKGMMLDFGGVGKELAVDCLRELAVRMGIERVLVDLGGDIAVQGDAPEGDGWYVGLEDPQRPGECYCGLRLRSGAAVATSGDYRRCFELNGRTFGHILDCRTGWPVGNGTRAATVIAARCVMAGLLSTSAIVLGGKAAIGMLERTLGVEGCLWQNGLLHETRGFRRSMLPREKLPAWFSTEPLSH